MLFAPAASPASWRRDRESGIVIGAAGVYALAAFLIHARFFVIGDLGVESDFYAELVVSAQRLLAGDFAVANYPFKGPLYSLFLAPLYGLLHPIGLDWYGAGVLLNALCAGVSLVLVYRLLRSLFPWPTAAAATLACGLQAEFFLLAHKASSDLLYFLFFIATVLALVEPNTRRRVFLAGVLAGLAFLTRYSGAILLPAGLLVCLLERDERVRRAALFGAGFLVLTLPWFVFSQATTGSWLQHGNLMNVVLEFYPGGDRPAPPAEGFHNLGQLIAHDPGYFLGHFLGNLVRRFGQDLKWVVGLLLSPLVVFGLVALSAGQLPARPGLPEWTRRYRLSREAWIFVGFCLLNYVALGLVFHRPRFALPHSPLYFVLIYGWYFGLSRQEKFLPDRRHLLVGLILVLAVSALQMRDSLDGLRQYRDRQPREVLEQAVVLRAQLPAHPEGSLLARKPHLAHYAGLEPVAYPQVISDWDFFWQYAFERDVKWVAVGPRERAVPGETRILDHLDEAAAVRRRLDAGGTALYELKTAARWQDWARIPRREELLEEARMALDVGDTVAAVGPFFDAGLVLVSIGDWDGAAPDLAQSLALWEEYPDSLEQADADYLRLTLALCRLELGQFRAGLEILGTSTGNLPIAFTESLEADRQYVTGRLLAGLDQPQRARGHLLRSLAMYEAEERREAARATRHYLQELGDQEKD